ncbi:hypothetical protein [Saccharomonospora glauca]|uniref:Uncharacterized protein n=1 Tax=Saccharomonospora glauca K62 TaxID=928724 RepID=I1D8E9_9PSEU|nr:hypothetical protein [Saccharomonospora glauca]EIF01224.1 hypothetical protein SacglDRAFT_00010 [Saccharomonospora glauca K62]
MAIDLDSVLDLVNSHARQAHALGQQAMEAHNASSREADEMARQRLLATRETCLRLGELYARIAGVYATLAAASK